MTLATAGTWKLAVSSSASSVHVYKIEVADVAAAASDNPLEDKASDLALATYSADVADAGDATAAKTKAGALVTAVLNGDVVTATVNDGTYTAPVAGTAAAPQGTAGSYKFTVTLSDGTHDAVTTKELTMAIAPAAYTPEANTEPGEGYGDAVTVVNASGTAIPAENTAEVLTTEASPVHFYPVGGNSAYTVSSSSTTATSAPSGVKYEGHTMQGGSNNPAIGNDGIPTGGPYFKFVVGDTAGKLETVFKVSANKTVKIVKADGTELVAIASGAEQLDKWPTTVEVEANGTYYMYATGGTKVVLYGFTFWPEETAGEDEVDKTALNAAITAAEKLDTTLPTSTDGSDIDQDKTWVTEKMKSDLTTALTAAKALGDDATQEQVDAAASALDTAVKAYVPAAGTKLKTMNPTVADYNKPYDGKAHGITIASDELPTGATVTYCDTESGTYAATPITITNVADSPKTVYYKVNAAGYAEFAGSATITITKAAAPTITVTPDLSEGIPAEGGKVTFTATGVPEGTLTGHCTQADEATNINFTMTNGKLQGVSQVAPNATDEAKTHTVSFTWADHPNYEDATIADVTLTQVKQGEVGTTKATGLAVDNKFAAKGVTATAADDNGVAITIDEAGILAAFAEDKTAFTADGVKHGSDAYIMVSFDAPENFDKATWKVQQTVSKDGVKGTPGAMWDWAENSTSGNELDVVGTDKIGDWFCVLKGVDGTTPAMPDAATYRMEYKFFDGDDNHVATVYYMVERAVTAAPVEYTVTVTGGTADKAKATEGADVTVTADAAPTGKVFDKWTTSDLTLSATDAAKAVLTFTMPAKNVALTATYKDDQGEQPGDDGELVEGEYRMSNKDNGSATVNCADGVIAGLTWNDGAAVGSSGHGVESVTGFTVKVPDGKTATLTLITCVYGTGAPITCTSGTATVGEAEAITGSEQDKDMKTVITGVTGTAQFAMTGSAYVHYVKVELEAGGNQPGDEPGDEQKSVVFDPAKLNVSADNTPVTPEMMKEVYGDRFTAAVLASGNHADYVKARYKEGVTTSLEIKEQGKASFTFVIKEGETVDVKAKLTSNNGSATTAYTLMKGDTQVANGAVGNASDPTEATWQGLTAGTYTLTSSGEKSMRILRMELIGASDDETGGDTVDKTALTAAITAAEAAVPADIYVVANDTEPSAVANGTKFMTESDKAAYDAALAAAKAVAAKADATQADVDAAKTALETAAGKVQTGTKAGGTTQPGDDPDPVSKTALTDAIKAAEGVYAIGSDVKVLPANTKASTVDKGQKFVTQDVYDALAKAIADAKAVLANDEATQAEVDAAVKALNDAKNAMKVLTGTKSNGGGNTSSSSNRGSGSSSVGTTTVTNPDGSKVQTEKKADGSVTITTTNPDGEVIAQVSIPATIPSVGYKFVDVPDEHWAAKSINDMAGMGMVQGVDNVNHIFDMHSNITRGSVAAILYRFANGKAGMTQNFSDVVEGQWFTDAVAWASNAGVVTGFEDGTFRPDGNITREQLAVMIARFAKLIGLDTASNGSLVNFKDGTKVQAWAVDGVTWCVANGIIHGRGDGTIDPSAPATRAEAAAMLDRFVQLLK